MRQDKIERAAHLWRNYDWSRFDGLREQEGITPAEAEAGVLLADKQRDDELLRERCLP